MKTISSELKAHLQQDLTTLATCWMITRTDGTIYAFTDHDQNLTVSGQTYNAQNTYSRSSIKTTSALSVDNLDIVGILDLEGSVGTQDILAGRFDYAQVSMFLVNWANLSQGILRLRQGWLGEVVITPTGVFQAELRGLTQLLTTQIGDVFQPVCRADLGDSNCTVDIASYTGTATVGSVSSQKTFSATTALQYTPYQNTNVASIVVSSSLTEVPESDDFGVSITVNGTTTLFDSGMGGDNYHLVINYLTAAINAANIGITATGFFSSDGSGGEGTNGITLNLNNPNDTATVQKMGDTGNWLTIDDFGDGYMNGGVVTWLSGSNIGLSMEINQYTQSTQTLQLFLNMPLPIVVGDTFSYAPGCDKRRETCYYKFNNMNNFRGEPDIPGIDATLTYPDFGQL